MSAAASQNKARWQSAPVSWKALDSQPGLQEFAAEIQQAERSEAAERAQAEQAEAELVQAERELSQLAASSSELDSLEERYWHDFNDFQLQLRAHVDERDVLLNKVCMHSCALSSSLAGPWQTSAACCRSLASEVVGTYRVSVFAHVQRGRSHSIDGHVACGVMHHDAVSIHPALYVRGAGSVGCITQQVD